MGDFNGWANWETWNVALWIGNDEGLYAMAKVYRHKGYKAFAEAMREHGMVCTPDDAPYLGKELDYEALDKMLGEL